MVKNNTSSLFGYDFECSSMDEMVLKIKKLIQTDKKIHLHTVNVDHIVLAYKDILFEKVIREADLVVADGMPIVWLSKLKKKNIPERITGIDLSKELCAKSSSYNFKLYFLGAGKGVGEKAKKNLEAMYPGVQIVGHYSPSREEINNEQSSKQIIKQINNSGANILLVALGAPKQEFWISQYKEELNTNLNIGVGATLDFMANTVNRAPVWMQKSGLEWFYRLIQEPKRMINRYLVQDSIFIRLAFKEIFQRK
ncbi:WecB/TagA/CpsF family glycosyltransferase [Priestia aryabhattai]|uniref:WecB/TagA/CpsF family glycosyltransferase n=1 Tax=Priestia aryabhattai TaxID=412384 RepID=UPI002E21367C|nr:WecB/TagA/CpsF family glycosyltransferase [Priestia aryabhattai]